MVATVLPNRSLLDLEFAAVIERATGFRAGSSSVPVLQDSDFDDQGSLISPYYVVYPRTGRSHSSNFAETQCLAEYPYQVTSVGQTGEQAQFAADMLRQQLLERAEDGNPINPIRTSDVVVLTLYTEMLGGSEPGGGGLWQVVDIFNLEVESIG